MARLRKRKTANGHRYLVDFRYQGKRHVLSLRTANKKLAERVKEEIEARIVRGVFHIDEQIGNNVTFSEFLKTYFASVNGTKSDATLRGERIYTNTFLRIVGHVPLQSISTATLERWRFERLKDVRPVTFNDERRVLSHIFSRAVESGHILSNPFRKVGKMKEQQHRLYLTSDELERFFQGLDIAFATARNRHHRAMYRKFKMFCEVLLNTGMRRSELLKLELNNVDFDNNLIRVEKTKGKKRREIPMTGRVRAILEELSPGFFADMTGDQVSHKFTDCAKKVGLKGLKLHSFRHTFGTLLLAMGYDITVAKELLGHEDIKTTLVYAKADSRLLRDAIRSFETLGMNGYKMVTETRDTDRKLLEEKRAVVSDEGTTTSGARNRT